MFYISISSSNMTEETLLILNYIEKFVPLLNSQADFSPADRTLRRVFTFVLQPFTIPETLTSLP